MWETLTSYKVLISPSTPIWSIKVKRTVASMTLAFDVPNYRGCQKCNSDKQGYGLMALSSYKYFHICKVLQCLPGADFFSQLPWFWVNPTKMQDEKNMFFFYFAIQKPEDIHVPMIDLVSHSVSIAVLRFSYAVQGFLQILLTKFLNSNVNMDTDKICNWDIHSPLDQCQICLPLWRTVLFCNPGGSHTLWTGRSFQLEWSSSGTHRRCKPC